MFSEQALAVRRALRLAIALPPSEAGDALSRISRYAITDIDIAALEFCRTYLIKHHEFPHPDVIASNVGVALPSTNEPLSAELESARRNYVEEGLRAAVEEASGHVQQGNPDAALTGLASAVSQIGSAQGSAKVVDLRDVEKGALARYFDMLAGKIPPPPSTGWPTLDNKGSFSVGDLLSIIGRPGAGKSWLLLRLGLYQWATYGKPCLFVTQEMTAEQVEERALPIVAGVPYGPLADGKQLQYEIGGLTHSQYIERLEGAAEEMRSGNAPFLIYDTKMAGTVEDVERIAGMHGIERVLIDGAYLMKHSDKRLNRYQRVAENLDLMKDWLQRAGVALATTWQFKRGAGKDDASEDADLDDIGYSNAVGEYSSIVIGLLTPPKKISQMKQRTVTVMKGRGGQVGSFDVAWDFTKMGFDEIGAEESEADLEHL